jgi:hypothetical protein
VQGLPVHVPGDEVHGDGQRHRDNDVTTGQAQVERKGDNRQSGGERQSRSEYPCVLVGADEQVTRLVRAVDRQTRDPDNRYQESQQKIVAHVRFATG